MDCLPRTAITLLLLLALPSAPAAAQTLHQFAGERHAYAWPSGLGTAQTFGRTAGGDFDGDLVADVLVLDGSAPVVLLDVDECLAPSELALTANDLDIARLASPLGRDAAVVVGASGVHLGWFDPVAHAFATALVASGPWAGAVLVRADDLDADGRADLVGAAADRTTILRLMGTAPGVFATATSQTAPWPARDLCPLQWDADPALELAVLSDHGVDVLDANGAPLASWTSALPGGAIARLRQNGQASDRLVWITVFAPPAQQWLTVLAQGGASDLVDLGALDACALEPGDYDADGDDDLLISHRYSHDLLWMENLRSPAAPLGPSFTGSSDGMALFRVGPPQSGAPANDAWPLFHDLDNDGDLDVFFPVEMTMEVEVLRGETASEVERKPTVESPSYAAGTGGGNGVVSMLLARPAIVDPTATHFEVELWRRAGLQDDMDQVALSRTFVALPASGTVSVSLAVPETAATFTRVYSVQVRTVQRDAAGTVLERFATQAWWFTMDPDTQASIQAMPDSGPVVPFVGQAPPEQGPSSGLVFRPNIKPWKKNVPPKKATPPAT